MKRLYFCLVLILALGLAIPAFAGNGLPEGATGKHYNLNIIGVSKNKTADMDGNHGHRIFVKLWGNSKIWLAEGDDFQVLDANGTDSDGAAFQLPNPDEFNTGTTAYSVFARELGKPGFGATMTTCLIDGATTYCSIYSVVFVRSTGKSSFRNVSKELLYVYADVGSGPERFPLFSDSYTYFWDYNNTGLKHAQLRFYPMATTVPNP
jgi:hypothetical protein